MQSSPPFDVLLLAANICKIISFHDYLLIIIKELSRSFGLEIELIN
jgi:hypothetical protein